MIRASSAYNICTDKPSFDFEIYNKDLEILKEKAVKKLGSFDINIIDSIKDTPGLKTFSNTVIKHLENLDKFNKDELPDGAKTYLKERWLELNYNLVDTHFIKGNFATVKGTYSEKDAIDLLAKYYKKSFIKNENRIEKDFISGEADVIYTEGSKKIVRDIKCPETWKTFKNKLGISLTYYWQLIAYCYLYDAEEAYLDYVLMPLPKKMFENFIGNMSDYEVEIFNKVEESIKNMPLKFRIKTYNINSSNIQDDIEFLKSRLAKSKEYYSNLTLEDCLQIV